MPLFSAVISSMDPMCALGITRTWQGASGLMSRTIAKTAECIIGNGHLVLRAQELVGEYCNSRDVAVPAYLLGESSK